LAAHRAAHGLHLANHLLLLLLLLHLTGVHLLLLLLLLLHLVHLLHVGSQGLAAAQVWRPVMAAGHHIGHSLHASHVAHEALKYGNSFYLNTVCCGSGM
jgi:hypothetical protein